MKYQAIAVMAFFLAGAQARAELLTGTQTNAPYAGRVAIGDYGLGGNYPVIQARPFTTGASPYNLTSIFFGSNVENSVGPGSLSISVHSNNGSLPGAVVEGGLKLFIAGPTSVGQLLNAGATVTLAANTTYWFVASADQSLGATRYWWSMTDAAAFDSDVPGYGMPLASANNAVGWMSYAGSSMQMQAYGAVVPEPGTLSLFGIAMGVAFFVRRRRSR